MKLFGNNANNKIDEKVTECIKKSMSVIEGIICPKEKVTEGLVERDDYHGGSGSNFSMLTSCQMLWAVTTAGTYEQSHYLVVDILTAIKKELESDYFKHKDRSFERSFLLLATTSAPMQFQDPLYISIIEQILDTQDANGFWGTCRNEPEDIRATALNILALSECHSYVGNTDQAPYSSIVNSVSKACNWLESKWSNDGYWERCLPGIKEKQSQNTPGVELTAWCTYALIRALECGCYSNDKGSRKGTNEVIKKSIDWLIHLDYDKIATTSEIEKEIYIKDISKPTEKKHHNYGAGSLEILILALINYRESTLYQYFNDFEQYMQKAVERLTKNMNSLGEWYDKNTDSYSRAWTVSYALKALTAYRHYLDSKNKFKAQIVQNSKIAILTIPKILWRYKLGILCIIITIIAMNFGDSVTQYVDFLNSKTCTAIGFICTVLGFLMGFRK